MNKAYIELVIVIIFMFVFLLLALRISTRASFDTTSMTNPESSSSTRVIPELPGTRVATCEIASVIKGTDDNTESTKMTVSVLFVL